jgi:hypothetical protein
MRFDYAARDPVMALASGFDPGFCSRAPRMGCQILAGGESQRDNPRIRRVNMPAPRRGARRTRGAALHGWSYRRQRRIPLPDSGTPPGCCQTISEIRGWSLRDNPRLISTTPSGVDHNDTIERLAEQNRTTKVPSIHPQIRPCFGSSGCVRHGVGSDL